jgi:hypothetical protein
VCDCHLDDFCCQCHDACGNDVQCQQAC